MGIDVSEILGHVGIKTIRTELTAEDVIEIVESFDGNGNIDVARLVLGLGPAIAGVTPDVVFGLSGDDGAALASVCEVLANDVFEKALERREELIKSFAVKPVTLGGSVRAEALGRDSKLALVGAAIGKEVDEVRAMPGTTFLALHFTVHAAKKGGPKTAALLTKLAEKLRPAPTDTEKASELH